MEHSLCLSFVSVTLRNQRTLNYRFTEYIPLEQQIPHEGIDRDISNLINPLK